MANIPVVLQNGSYTALPKGQNLSVPESLGTGMTTLLTSESMDYSGVKVKLGTSASLANGGTVDVDISDATSDFVVWNTYSTTTNAATSNISLALDDEDDWIANNFTFNADNGRFYLDPDYGFYDYGSMTYENVTDYTKLQLWSLSDNSYSDIFKSWIATASTNGDPTVEKQKTLTIASSDTSTKTLKLISNEFMIPNYGSDMKLEFYFDTATITAGGTVNYVKVEIVDAKNPDDTVLFATDDLWALGSGHVSTTLSDDIYNRPIRFAISVSFTGAVGPAEVSFTIDQLQVIYSDTNKVVKLYRLDSTPYLKPEITTYLDYSTVSSDWALNKIAISDNLQNMEGIYVAISKDYDNWYYYDGTNWVLLDVNNLYGSTMTAKDLADLGREELDFLLRDNSEKKLYFMFTVNESVKAKSYSVYQVIAQFKQQDVYNSVNSGIDVEIIPRRKVTFTNNTGGAISGFVASVAYV